MSLKECIIDFINKYNTDEAFYIIDLSKIKEAYSRWNKILSNIQPYYAVKCNPDEKILRLLKDLGSHFDCASKNEIDKILDITNDPNKIIFAHPCKYSSHLIYSYKNNVNLMTLDNEDELYKIKLFHPNAEILIRLAVNDSHSICKFNTKFGCLQDDVINIVKRAKSLKLNIVGVSFHVGSMCKSSYVYYDALKICSDVKKIYNENGYEMKIIDIGGGFSDKDIYDGVKFEEMGEMIQKGIKFFFNNTDIKYIAEPGRFFVEKSHTLVLRIIAKKKKDDVFLYYINDGIYGSFNCIIFDHQKPEFIPLNSTSDTVYKSKIFGNTCDSMDIISDIILLPELFINDYIYVENFGAYTTSAKSDSFNGYKVINKEYI